ncbi:NAD(P)/FAD-dependent oxidoreductase [Maribacter sp. 1_2014MBL_MicDiv]|uniref:NAD(P)/FAD-dependent oxidoreductase n=1 Tax=Maribacter sp. 1_2014MBL_MicDiv TaxID=1644130 RepID=UPI0008F48CDF|nr:NAD(P)/FAD-dependent oxidoreductase [Maribacter sp. 1_2014MBL_MicDiv]APA66025.1 oxidoreductase [Maribacter sp. 1_2014MBL_MicDiv]
MDKQDYKIHIIGAGVSGLIAATVLEQNGFSPIIFEASDRVGGRVKTDKINGYQLDQGFQVLLTAYPAAQKYLDYKSLELQHYLPGASIFKNKKQEVIGDPLRVTSLLFSTLFSSIGSFSDKLKILKLNTRLKNKTIDEIFSDKEQSTLSYLKSLDFSESMINDFFKPFFSGIFLEDQLETSSRMFEFVYKMFGEGSAALPKGGIEEIPKQLLQKLENTKVTYNSAVSSVVDGKIILSNGQEIASDFIIVATEASSLIQNLKNQKIDWKRCDTLYFETEDRAIQKPLIGLIPDQNTLINNIVYHTGLKTSVNGGKELLSVTVVNNQGLSGNTLVDQVQKELKEFCGITTSSLIKHYSIPRSLPKLNDLQYEISPSETRLTETIYLAGDVQLNGSLNAAMIAGEKAALGVIENLQGLFK